MSLQVHDGICTIEGENGQRIGVNPNYTAMRVYVGKAGASLTEVSGFETQIMPGWFEVRASGAVGVKG